MNKSVDDTLSASMQELHEIAQIRKMHVVVTLPGQQTWYDSIRL